MIRRRSSFVYVAQRQFHRACGRIPRKGRVALSMTQTLMHGFRCGAFPCAWRPGSRRSRRHAKPSRSCLTDLTGGDPPQGFPRRSPVQNSLSGPSESDCSGADQDATARKGPDGSCVPRAEPAVAFLTERLQWRNGRQNALLGQRDNSFGALAQFRQEFECTAVQFNEILNDRQAEPRSASAFSWASEPCRKPAEPWGSRGGNAGTSVEHGKILSAVGRRNQL